jgi:hypothetical protein
MFAVMMDRLSGGNEILLTGDRCAGVGVTVEARKVGTGNFQADAMAFEKDVARDAYVDFVFRDLTVLERFFG